MYTVDTNIAIAFLDGEESVRSFLREAISRGKALYVPATVETELFSFPLLSEVESIAIDTWLAVTSVLQTNSQINRSAGALRREYHMNLGDARLAERVRAPEVEVDPLDRSLEHFIIVHDSNPPIRTPACSTALSLRCAE